MASFFESMGRGFAPEGQTDRAMQQGLLQFGAGLLQNRTGNFASNVGGAISPALTRHNSVYDADRAHKLNADILKLKQGKSKAAKAKLAKAEKAEKARLAALKLDGENTDNSMLGRAARARALAAGNVKAATIAQILNPLKPESISAGNTRVTAGGGRETFNDPTNLTHSDGSTNNALLSAKQREAVSKANATASAQYATKTTEVTNADGSTSIVPVQALTGRPAFGGGQSGGAPSPVVNQAQGGGARQAPPPRGQRQIQPPQPIRVARALRGKTGPSATSAAALKAEARSIEKYVDTVPKLLKDIDSSNKIYNTNKRVLAMLNSGKLETGFGEAGFNVAKAFMQDMLGMEIGEERTVAEAFRSMTQQNVNQMLSAAGGVQTDGDAERASIAWARMGNSVEGNKFIVTLALVKASHESTLRKMEIELYEEDKKAVKAGVEGATIRPFEYRAQAREEMLSRLNGDWMADPRLSAYSQILGVGK